jgi:hypothetical protein
VTAISSRGCERREVALDRDVEILEVFAHDHEIDAAKSESGEVNPARYRVGRTLANVS